MFGISSERGAVADQSIAGTCSELGCLSASHHRGHPLGESELGLHYFTRTHVATT